MMVLDALFLCVLLVALFITFFGLLHRTVNRSCRKRTSSERLTRRQAERTSGDSFSEVFVNSAYQPDVRNNDSGIFPAAPPPYSQNYVDPPPKYEDVIKTEEINAPATIETRNENATAPNMPRVHSTPPPYTIST